MAGRTDVVVNFPAFGDGIGIAGERIGIRRRRPSVPLSGSRKRKQQSRHHYLEISVEFHGSIPLSGRRIRQRERKEVRIGPDRYVLFPVDAVSHGTSRNQSARIEMPQHLAGLGVESRELSLLLAPENNPAGS